MSVLGEEFMSAIPEHELAALRALSGYDKMLEMDRIMKQYGIDEVRLALLQGNSNQPAQAAAPPFVAETKFVENILIQQTYWISPIFDLITTLRLKQQSVAQKLLKRLSVLHVEGL